MRPPQFVLDDLQRTHKWLRLGWVRHDKRTPTDDLNRGAYYLIQLISQRAATIEFNEPWRDRGPVYGDPYDPLARVPFIMAGPFETDGFADVPGEDFWTWGSLVKTVRRMLEPVYERTVETAKEAAKTYDEQVHDLAGEMSEYLRWRANQTDATNIRDRPKDDLTDEDREVLSGDKLAKAKEDVRIPQRIV